MSPTEISPAGWKDILWQTVHRINEDRVTMVAASVTYYTLLALVPALSAIVSIYGLFTDPASVRERIDGLSGVIPQGGMQIIDEQLTRLTEHGGGTLGFALIVSLALALWSASAGVKTMFEAMNIAYGEREKRNFFVVNGLALLFTLAGVLGALLLMGVAVLLPGVLGFFGVPANVGWPIQIGSYLALIVAMLVAIAALYRWGPSRRHARWRWITPGAVLAVVAIILMSILFSWYAANFAHYDKTYGSLGGLIGLLTWMWLSITALVIGAELDAEAERQKRQDVPPQTAHAHPALAAEAPAATIAAQGGATRFAAEPDARANPRHARLLVPLLLLIVLLRRRDVNRTAGAP